MTYKTAFPQYKGPIPDVFLAAPWTDVSWPNDTCPSFSRTFDGGREVHVYVDEDNPRLRDYWTDADGKQEPCPRYTVRLTDNEGSYDENDLGWSSDNLVEVLDRVGFLTGEVSR